MGQSKIYFKGLNGLRFFAAFLVVIYHAEFIRIKYNLFSLNEYSLFRNGELAVEFFFVLSGFLITYLLMAEKSVSGTINVKYFYLRRILRIWPLYYLILAIGLIFIPMGIKMLNIDYKFPFPVGAASVLFVLFLPNAVFSIWPSNFLVPLWSIGVEEQFYLIWAPLIKVVKQHVIYLFLSIILLRMIFYAYYSTYDKSVHSALLSFIFSLKFESMSIGGLGAWALYRSRNRILRSNIFSISAQLLFFAIIIIRLCFNYILTNDPTYIGVLYRGIFNGFYSSLITGPIFLWLIINISSNPKTLVNTDGKILNFLGNLSYGIYMYHGIVIFVVLLLLKEYIRKLHPILATSVLYTATGGLTILAAYVSYFLIESKFLKLKKLFEPDVILQKTDIQKEVLANQREQAIEIGENK